MKHESVDVNLTPAMKDVVLAMVKLGRKKFHAPQKIVDNRRVAPTVGTRSWTQYVTTTKSSLAKLEKRGLVEQGRSRVDGKFEDGWKLTKDGVALGKIIN